MGEYEWAIKAVLGGAIGHLWWSKKKETEKLDSTMERLTRLEEKHASMLGDVGEIKQDTKEIKKSMVDLLVKVEKKHG